MQLDNRLSLQRGKLHLYLELNGVRIAYAYIRKNGCSAFKRAMGFDPTTQVDNIAKTNRWRPWQRFDHAIFVYRDPLERLISLYRNKVIDGRGSADILRTYYRTMREAPTTFERFVEFACLEEDPHCWKQTDHLKPLNYTAVALSQLYPAMSEIVGPGAAEIFRRKENSSSPHQIEITDRARAMLKEHYAKDYALICRIGESAE